jgi:magnesium-protoporphyrin O-methyltransferase
MVAVQNATFRRSGNTFQTFAHPPEEMLAVLERRGMRQVHVC